MFQTAIDQSMAEIEDAVVTNEGQDNGRLIGHSDRIMCV